MPAGIDLGKQYGPLPLGAWVVVVGGALGLAWYTRRSGGGVEPQVTEDVSGTPGVGVGAPADWTPITGTPAPVTTAPTTNEAWAVKAIQWGIAMNYPSNMVDSAVRKYLAGLKLSVQEYTFIGLALVANGPPPQPLPPGEETDPPPSTDPPPATGYVGPAVRKSPPEGRSTWLNNKPGFTTVVHSNWTATYRGGYTNIAPAGSTAEKLHIAALMAKNAMHGYVHRWGKTIYLPARLNDNGTWVA
jgi:hypothetical protein